MKFITQQVMKDIMYIEINRPEVRNAINLGLIDELQEAFRQAKLDQSVRVIMVSGAGDKAFSSGGDLQEFHTITTIEDATSMMNRAAALINAIADSPKLTIAAINGYALGGGAELTTAFDIRIASENARIGFVQSKLGITSAWGGGSRLISLIGQARALPMLISGEINSIDKWVQVGYIDQVYPVDTFRAMSLQYAQKMAERSNAVIHAYKTMCQRGIDREILQKSILAEIATAATLWVSDEHLQAANQFMNKNK